MVYLLIFATILLAYTNGANDNFKGVATIYGSKTSSYKTSLFWATLTTFAGALYSIYVAHGLVESFSGKGLVSAETLNATAFLTSVALGAALTVLLATLTGFPISTTHSLIGGLIGAGLMAEGMNVNFVRLGEKFLIPLLASPFIAAVSAAILYFIFNRTRRKLNVTKETCICVGDTFVPVAQTANIATKSTCCGDVQTEISISSQADCKDIYTGNFMGLSSQSILDKSHFFSAGAVCFARGLNDTPKIVGLIVMVKLFDIQYGMFAIAVAMIIGGLLNSRKVAETMSLKMTEMNNGQGFTANIITSFLVIVASKWGVPVSTTHVSVGSILGIGAVSGKGDKKVIKGVLGSWILTLPIATTLASLLYLLLA